jgi:PAS domain S-box-containing protein
MANKARTRPKPPASLRQRAQAALRPPRADLAGMSAKAVRKLLRELRLHQIELEERVRRRTAELQAANLALQTSERTLADFFAAAPMGLLWVASDGCILRVNQAQLALLGRRGEDLVGRRLAQFFPDAELVADLLARLARKETLHNYPARLRRKDGSLRHILINANGLWEKGKLVHSRWFVRDVTPRVELEQEMLLIGERVQRRIGQDLHDHLCQQLAGIEFLSRALERRLAANAPTEAARARQLAQLTRQAIAHTRELARGMSLMEPEPGGLAAALRNLAPHTKKLFHCDCRFRGDSTARLEDRDAETHLYRIAHEAVANAVKHGKAKHIEIGLRRHGNRIVLSVQDDGRGLPAKLRPGKGLGLRIMDFRARALGGSLAVRRRQSGGTALVCSVPTAAMKPASQPKA